MECARVPTLSKERDASSGQWDVHTRDRPAASLPIPWRCALSILVLIDLATVPSSQQFPAVPMSSH